MTNPWQREGLMYRCRLQWIRGPYRGTSVKELDFVTYHLILWIRGQATLIEMAKMIPKDWES